MSPHWTQHGSDQTARRRLSAVPAQHRWLGMIVGSALCMIGSMQAPVSRAAEPVSAQAVRAQPAQPSEPQGSTSLLQQISRETEGLYQRVRPSIVEVTLPAASPWVHSAPARQSNPLAKWGDLLDPAMRRHLENELASHAAGHIYAIRIWRGNPSGAADELAVQVMPQNRWPQRLLNPPDAGFPVIGPLRGGLGLDQWVVSGSMIPVMVSPGLLNTADIAPAPRCQRGVILGQRGLVLVPQYIDPIAAAAQPLRVALADGSIAWARFIGSDRPTDLTLLQLARSPAPGAGLSAAAAPDDGALVMVLAPTGAARLQVWTGANTADGVVVRMDGTVAGVARNGQFLAARAWGAVVTQLAARGQVDRPPLGVAVRQMTPDDALRARLPALDRHAAGLCVVGVETGSPAHAAGFRAGDWVLEMAGQPAGDLRTFAATIAAQRGPTSFVLMRDGKTVAVTADLQSSQ